MGKNKSELPRNVARIVIEADFEIDSTALDDVMSSVRNALDELRYYGFVRKADLEIPASKLDLAETM